MRSLGRNLCALLCLLGTFSASRAAERPLEIVFADMQGGAGTLIVTPAGESVLIDCGSRCGDQRDARRIAAAAKALGLEAIDHLVITHYDSDHWGGTLQLSRLIPVRRFYDHGPLKEHPRDRNYASYLADYEKACKGARTTLRAGDRLPLRAAGKPPVEILCVAARARVGDRAAPTCTKHRRYPKDKTENVNSIALVLEHGRFRVFFAGDITKNIEHDLVCPANRIGEADLYQVSHHGLPVSNNPLLVRAIDPSVAIFLNGKRKGAHPDVHAALKACPHLRAVWQLHENLVHRGVNPPAAFIANPGPKAAGTPIRLTCDLAAQRFALCRGLTGNPIWYPIRPDKARRAP